MEICTFLWIYYGYPASSYEGINVEQSRYRCGAALADNDEVEIDYQALDNIDISGSSIGVVPLPDKIGR